MRTLEYTFPRRMLEAKELKIKSTFKVGDNKTDSIVMIEKHFHNDDLLETYEFR